MTPPTCPACGAQVEQGTAICDNCGLVLAPQSRVPLPVSVQAATPNLSQERPCPQCGTAIPHGRRSCPSCGRGLTLKNGAGVGATVARNRFLITGPLGNGGMGSLFLAKDMYNSSRLVALKLLSRHEPETKELFLREGAILGELDHPAIPHMVTVFEDQGIVGLVIDYAPGHSLGERLSHTDPATGTTTPGQPYSQTEVLRWGVALCRLLSFLASHPSGPYIHQDIKPANIIIDPATGLLSLIDFGVAARYTPGNPAQSSYGTVGYAPVEQYRGQSEPRSDVYALAATLYHLITDDDPSEHPFQFPKLDELGALGPVLSTALEKEPDHRPTAEEFGKRLAAMLKNSGTTVLLAPDGTPLEDRAELLQWCTDHWADATDWLHNTLPSAIGTYWGDLETARQFRNAQKLADRDASLGEALIALNGQTVGSREPHLICTPNELRVHASIDDHEIRKTVTLQNDSPKPIPLDLPTLHWASFEPNQLVVVPGQTITVEVIINVRKVPVLTPRRYRLTVGDPRNPVFDLKIVCGLGPLATARRMFTFMLP